MNDFDIGAAWYRRSQGDLSAFMEAFAARMSGAFPDRTTIERKRDGLFSKSSHVVKIGIQGEHNLYTLAIDGKRMLAMRTKTVRGVSLKSEEMAVPEWLAMLGQDMQAIGEQAGSADNVLHDFLMS